MTRLHRYFNMFKKADPVTAVENLQHIVIPGIEIFIVKTTND